MKIVITEEDMSLARQLIAEGYYQVSRRYRTVARLPKDKTGKEALFEAACHETDNTPLSEDKKEAWRKRHEDWVNAIPEDLAKDFFLRVHAGPSLEKHLTIPEFEAFRKAGGKTAY